MIFSSNSLQHLNVMHNWLILFARLMWIWLALTFKSRHNCLRYTNFSSFSTQIILIKHQNMVCNFVFVIIKTLIVVHTTCSIQFLQNYLMSVQPWVFLYDFIWNLIQTNSYQSRNERTMPFLRECNEYMCQ